MVRTLCVLGLLVGISVARADEKEDPIVARLKKLLEERNEEVKELKKRVEKLEEERTQLVLDKETAIRQAKTAQSNEKQARDILDEKAQKIVELTAKVRELKLLTSPPREKPLPSSEVTKTSGHFVVINIGSDVGLEVGTVFEVIRTDGKKENSLGTIEVVTVYPKGAILGNFVSARVVPVDKLKPKEFPDKGDTVRPQVPAPRK